MRDPSKVYPAQTLDIFTILIIKSDSVFDNVIFYCFGFGCGNIQMFQWYGRLAGCINGTMMTSSNNNIFRVTGHLCREITGSRWIPRTKANDAELGIFFDLRLNKRLSKQS